MKRFIVFILLTSPIFGLSFARADPPTHDISSTSVRNSFRFFTELDFSAHETSSKLDNSERAIWKIFSLEIDEGEKDIVMNGTGFFVGANHVITNFHVISSMLSRPENDILLLQGENVAFIKRILALSAVYDLALLEVERFSFTLVFKKEVPEFEEEVPVSEREGEDADFLSLGEDPSDPSADLFVTAYPKGVFTRMKKTADIFSVDGQQYAFSVNRSDLHGASGAPVLNDQGQVVGVVAKAIDNFLYVIKASYLRAFLAGDIGMICHGSKPVMDCIKEEMENLKELAEEGSVYAQYNLDLFYFSGWIDQNVKEVFHWMKEAAEQGYVPAQHGLAVMYFKGEGVDQDLNQAFQWMQKAAEQGYAPAQHGLALMYEEGEGVDQDLNQAFQWMKEAAEQGYVPAQHSLAVMYFKGEGVDQDLNQAFQWMKEAAEQGYVPASA